jgi:hypothetical protein
MGYSTALDLATQENLNQAVSMHFASNCYPPIPQIWVEQAVVAIYDVASDDGDNLIDLPTGVTTRNGETQAKAGFIVNSLRLEAFVDAMVAQQFEDDWVAYEEHKAEENFGR